MQLVRDRFLVQSEVPPHLHLDFLLRITLPLVSIHRLETPTAGEGNQWLLFSRIGWFEKIQPSRKTHSGHSPPTFSHRAFKTRGLLLTGPSDLGLENLEADGQKEKPLLPMDGR